MNDQIEIALSYQILSHGYSMRSKHLFDFFVSHSNQICQFSKVRSQEKKK